MLLLIVLSIACALSVACSSTGRAGTRGKGVERTVLSADQVPILCRVAGAERGDPTIVLVHGFGCDSTVFEPQIAHLSRRLRVLALDLPGHGRSGDGRKTWTMEAYGDDVRAACDAIGASQVVLVGHSMGGPVILEAARAMPGRVLALVPIETFHDVERVPSGQQIEDLLTRWRTDFAGSAALMVRGSFHQPNPHPDRADVLVTKMAAMRQDVGLSLLEAMFRYDVARGLKGTTLPIRCLNSADRPTNLAAGRRLASRFDARAIPNVGHYPMSEDPDALNALLDAAIDELTH